MGVKHTPGPWYALDDCVYSGLEVRGGGYHYPLAKMCSYWDGPGPREAEAKANYRLIACAPDLLAACQQAESHLVELYRTIAPASEGRFADHDVSVQQLRAVIAQALDTPREADA